MVIGKILTVRQGGGGGFVEQAHSVEARDVARVKHRPSLRVGEEHRDGHHGVGDLGAVVVLSDCFQVGKDHGDEASRGERFLFPHVINRDHDFVVRPRGAREQERGQDLLDLRVRETQTDQFLQIDDRVCGLHVDLVGGGAPDEALGFRVWGEGLGCRVGCGGWGPVSDAILSFSFSLFQSSGPDSSLLISKKNKKRSDVASQRTDEGLGRSGRGCPA